VAEADDLPPGYRLEALETIDSTNAEALRRAAAGETGPLWLRAVEQTGGRGRGGRRWSSPPGNLYASLLIRLDMAPARVSELSLVTGVALHRVVAALLPDAAATGELHLKWPNDLLIDRAKLAGALIETSIIAGAPGVTAVIGVGVNIASHPNDIGRPATDLAKHGADLPPAELLSKLAAALDRCLHTWRTEGFAPLRAEWLRRGLRFGVDVAVNTREGPLRGRFAGLAEDGALMVKSDDGVEHRVTFGDVSIF
jgi:BirA family biotin operon repressor/biotin-[acetyl-CoA-carboxylase] ligase